ncbi:hypothetical protein ACHAXR_002428 [Thalassiosira sp. AJA248-18]
MTKRSADEALAGRKYPPIDLRLPKEQIMKIGREPSHHHRQLAADDAGYRRAASLGLGPAKAPSSHRVSLISSSSSSACSIASSATTKPSLHRMVTSISSISSSSGAVDDNDVTTEVGQKCGSNGSIDTAASVTTHLTRLINARILQRDGTLLPGSITANPSSGLIVEINIGQPVVREEELSNKKIVVEVVDCGGHILSPGFIDIQLNGAYGVDFSNDGSHDEQSQGLATKDILYVAQRLVQTGVTSFCPTMISSSRQTYRRILPLMRMARKQQHEFASSDSNRGGGANILGMHLEGPFFASPKRGAHDLQHLTAPTKGMASVEEVYGINQQNEEGDEEVPVLEDIDIITLAPEIDGAFGAIQSLTGSNPAASSSSATNSSHAVVVSCGHTEATYDDGIKALSRGATLLTHLYNAMNPFHHRKPGLVGLLSSEAKLGGMDLKRPFFSMIVDGIHVHESAVCMAYQSHPHGCVLVTDAMTAMGLGDGEHLLGNMKVSIKGDRATLAGTDTLAGSVVSMDTCVRRFRRFTQCSVGEALLCATLHPAMVLKRHVARQQKRMQSCGDVVDAPFGIFEVGAKADLVMVNDDLDVLGTWISGRLAFEKK